MHWYEMSASQNFALAQYGLYKLQWQKGENDLALDWLNKAAGAGYPPAQVALGSYCWRTSKSASDRKKAVKWVLAAADMGDFSALSAAALMYEEGLTGETSREMALNCLKKGAEAGSSTCAQMLADRLLNTDASESEVTDGLRWLWYAAEKGEPFAYSHLSQIYRFGLYGTPVDRQIAALFDSLAGEAVSKKMV